MTDFCKHFLRLFLVSTVTKGRQMIPVLNKIGVHAALYGNHDFGKFTLNLKNEHKCLENKSNLHARFYRPLTIPIHFTWESKVDGRVDSMERNFFQELL